MEKIEFKFSIDIPKANQLKKIVEDLYQKKSIKTDRITDFMVLTTLIVINEYENNPESLIKFYESNSKKLDNQYKTINK